jgi:hypothetical protein
MQELTLRCRCVTALVALVAVTLAVMVAVSVGWMTGSDSSTRSSGVEAPAPTATTTDPRGAVTDAGVNPWAMNDPATVLRFLEERCPDGPPVTSVDELLPTLQACLALTPQGLSLEQTQQELVELFPSGH